MPLMNTIKFITTHPLNRDKKFNALIRFAKWQIGSRLVPGNVICDWINGAKFLARTGETGITGNIYTGLHEFADMAFLLHVLRDDDLFVDVGANVGSYTILACAAIGAKGYAFEPVPATYKRLVENIRINHLEDRVQYLNMGVGREPAMIAFTSDMDTTNHALAHGEQNANAIDVEITTLDTALLNQSPSLLKIDVEGYETAVLEGAMVRWPINDGFQVKPGRYPAKESYNVQSQAYRVSRPQEHRLHARPYTHCVFFIRVGVIISS